MLGKSPRGVSKRPKNTKKEKAIPSWLWLVVLVLAGMCVMIFLALWRPWQPAPKQTPNASAETTQQDTNKDYRFYDLLPQQQVTPIPEQAIPEHKSGQDVMVIQAPRSAEKPKSTSTEDINDPFDETVGTATIQADPNYILQIRSYEDPDQADARRAEIILNGLSAEVIIANEGNQIWYKVISGPYPSQEAASIAQQTLQNGGIDSFIVKQH